MYWRLRRQLEGATSAIPIDLVGLGEAAGEGAACSAQGSAGAEAPVHRRRHTPGFQHSSWQHVFERRCIPTIYFYLHQTTFSDF